MNVEAYFKVTYGLYVVSSMSRGKLNGYVSNTVSQVAAEPAQFAIACSKRNLTVELIQQSRVFAISVLAMNTQAELIKTFGYKSGREVDKFAGFKYQIGRTGAPILLDNTVAWFECEVMQTLDVGSHLVFVGKVVDGALLDAAQDPLTYAYYREVKKGKAPPNAPTYIAPEKLDEARRQAPVRSPQYRCPACGYVYDPAEGDSAAGIAPGTRFEDLPDRWICPVCGCEKAEFVQQD